jgi:hypothetical protein
MISCLRFQIGPYLVVHTLTRKDPPSATPLTRCGERYEATGRTLQP